MYFETPRMRGSTSTIFHPQSILKKVCHLANNQTGAVKVKANINTKPHIASGATNSERRRRKGQGNVATTVCRACSWLATTFGRSYSSLRRLRLTQCSH